MPIYEYKCSKCGFKFEELMSKEQDIKCPHCGNIDCQKLISNFSLGRKSSSYNSNSSNGVCDLTCPTCES